MAKEVRITVFVIPQETGDRVSRLAAFVVAPTVSAETVKQELRRRIDPVFLPRPLCFVEALPRNATGKLVRKTSWRATISRTARARAPTSSAPVSRTPAGQL